MSARRLKFAVFVVAIFLGWDLARAPERQLSAKALVAAIDLYQSTLSPALSIVGAQCRFAPTCSHYGEEVVRRHGALKGSWLAAKRIARCGPWTPLGTFDPPD